MIIKTYRSADGEWLAHMNFGNNTFMNFFGPTEEAAHNKATTFYENEKARWGRIDASASVEPTGKLPGNVVLRIAGKGQVFVGKVWMLNRDTGERARVEADQVSIYEAKGFIKGGPRSK